MKPIHIEIAITPTIANAILWNHMDSPPEKLREIIEGLIEDHGWRAVDHAKRRGYRIPAQIGTEVKQ